MKREDLKAGAEYATIHGVKITVVDPEEIGWRVVGDEFERAETWGQRFVKNKGYVPYQTNITVRAVEAETGAKVAIEPRNIVAPWEDYVREATQEQKRAAIIEQNAAALEQRAQNAGVTALVDPRKEEVRLPFDAFDSLLRLAKA